jgi:hypothetical protein
MISRKSERLFTLFKQINNTMKIKTAPEPIAQLSLNGRRLNKLKWSEPPHNTNKEQT